MRRASQLILSRLGASRAVSTAVGEARQAAGFRLQNLLAGQPASAGARTLMQACAHPRSTVSLYAATQQLPHLAHSFASQADAAAASAPADAPAEKRVTNVASTSIPSKVAGFLLKELAAGASPTVQAAGAPAVFRALKAAVIASSITAQGGGQLLLTFSPAVGNPVGVRLGLETAVTPLDTSGNAAWFSLRAYSVGDPAHDGSQLAKALKESGNAKVMYAGQDASMAAAAAFLEAVSLLADTGKRLVCVAGVEMMTYKGIENFAFTTISCFLQ